MLTEKRSPIVTVILYVGTILLAALFLFPIVWVLLSSFKPAEELFNWPPSILAQNPTMENFTTAISKGNFGMYIGNTFFVAIVATLLTLIINAMAGYVFAKYKFRGRGLFFGMVMATMMIPLEVIMIPIFRVIVNFGMYDSLWGIIIPALATPTGIFLIRQYYMSIPGAYMEAARIDGASETLTFVRIMLPMAAPVLAVLSIFSFMWRWNDFLWPKIVIMSQNNYTLQLALATFSGEFSVDWNSVLAMSVISMVPVLIVFLAFQKHIVGGITLGGVKG